MAVVSVIVPAYNAEEHIEECIASICSQTLKDIEIICVDDGSTDSTGEILARLAEDDSRIRIIHQENSGAGAARNTGLRAARGKYLSFLDADDFFEPEMLEEAYRKAEEDVAELVLYKANFYYEKSGMYAPCLYGLREDMLPRNKPFAGRDIEQDAFKTVVGWAWDKLFRTQFIRDNGLWFQEQRTSNDLLFVFCALVRADRITTVTKVLVHQRRGDEKRLSVTRERSWSCFYYALTGIREQLKEWGLYERFEQDFINYALHFSLWNLNTLKDPTKKILYNTLRTEWFKGLGIVGYPKEKFYHRGEYKQYQQIMMIPYNKYMQCIIGLGQRGLASITRIVHQLQVFIYHS